MKTYLAIAGNGGGGVSRVDAQTPARYEGRLAAVFAGTLLAIGAVGFLSLAFELPQPFARLMTGFGFGVMGVFTAVQVWRGYSRPGIAMSIAGTVLVIGAIKAILPANADSSRAMPAFVLLIGMAGLLVGRRAGWLTAGLCIAIMIATALWRASMLEWQAAPLVLYDLVVFGSTYLLMAFVSDYAVRQLNLHYEQAMIAQTRLEEQHRQKDAEIALRTTVEAQLTELVDGMRAVVVCASELLACETHERLWRRAVELPRERLGVERCSIYLYDAKRKRFSGTFGTSTEGHTTDERREWFESNQFDDESLAKPYHIHPTDHLKNYEGAMRLIDRRGWVVQTPIRTTTGEPVAAMYNDTGISGAPLSHNRQELLVVYCALLGAAIERLRLEQGFERAAVAEERARLARELHDSVTQALFGISLGAHTALQRIGERLPDERPTLDYILNLTQGALAEMRALVFELRPESLAQDGLVPALRKQVEALTARHRLKAVLVADDGEPALPIGAKEALYRIAVEAVQNIVKHARATQIDMRLSSVDDAVLLEINDNGAGFDTASVSPTGYGLITMRERAERLKGRLSVDSAPGAGTRITVSLPLDPRAQGEDAGLSQAAVVSWLAN